MCGPVCAGMMGNDGRDKLDSAPTSVWFKVELQGWKWGGRRGGLLEDLSTRVNLEQGGKSRLSVDIELGTIREADELPQYFPFVQTIIRRWCCDKPVKLRSMRHTTRFLDANGSNGGEQADKGRLYPRAC